MDINNQIFNLVENTLKTTNNQTDMNIFLKMCLGTATDEEKNKYIVENKLSKEDLEKLENSCKYGYESAEKVDLSNKVEELNSQIQSLTDIVEHVILDINLIKSKLQIKDKNPEIQIKDIKIDSTNMSQYI